MKNFQQTPKMRRLAMTAHKATLAGSRPQSFQPREAWSTKKTLSGVPVSVLDDKQLYPSSRRRTAWDYGMCYVMPREARRPY